MFFFALTAEELFNCNECEGRKTHCCHLFFDSVDAGFDDHDIPYDVLWLDIEHTDGKK